MVSPCVAFTRLLERVYPGFTMSVGVVYHAKKVDVAGYNQAVTVCVSRVRA